VHGRAVPDASGVLYDIVIQDLQPRKVFTRGENTEMGAVAVHLHGEHREE
jgi:hypothetical protein